jgi:integrase
MPPHGPHTLRHTFCSRLAMRVAAVGAIQALAGHQDLMAAATADSLRENPERRLVSREGIEPDPATSRN